MSPPKVLAALTAGEVGGSRDERRADSSPLEGGGWKPVRTGMMGNRIDREDG